MAFLDELQKEQATFAPLVSTDSMFRLLVLNSKLGKIFPIECDISHLTTTAQISPLPESLLQTPQL